MEYGVNVTNKFAFLSEDEDAHDPAEILSNLEQQKAKVLAKQVVKKADPPIEKKVVIVTPTSANKENLDGARRGPPRGDRRAGNDRREGGGAPRREGGDGERRSGPRPPRRFEGGNQFVAGGEGAETRPPRNNNVGGGGTRPNGPRNGPPGERPRRFNRDGGEQRPPRNGGDKPTEPATDGQGDWISQNNNNNNDENRRTAGNRNNNFRRGGARREGGERHSGSEKTGLRSVPKKEGHGKGNWGTNNQEANNQDTLKGETENLEKLTVNGAEHPDENVPQLNCGDEIATGDEAKLEEETKREITLEEWKAQCKAEQPQFKVRKAGEGGDQKIYQKLVPIKKLVKDTATDGDEEEVQVKREPREKPLNIEVCFRDSQRNRGGRGGYRDNEREDRGARGGGFRDGGEKYNERRNFRRGPENSGGRRGGPPNNNQNNINTFHLTAESFPALGGS